MQAELSHNTGSLFKSDTGIKHWDCLYWVNMSGFKPISAVEGSYIVAFSNLRMKASVSLYHQESVQCLVNLLLAPF